MPDLPATPLEEPADIVRATPVTFTWRGGSPEVARDWIPRVTVQRRVVDGYVTVATEGTGEILLWQITPAPGDSRWTAVWQPLFDAPVGSYRFAVDGRRQEALADVPYSLTSRSFEVSHCLCIEATSLAVRHVSDGTIHLSVAASYSKVTQGFRLLPERVSTGRALVDAVRDGELVDTISLSFVSRVELVSKTVGLTHPDMTILEPTELGAFEAAWSGDADVTFELAGVTDDFGNSS